MEYRVNHLATHLLTTKLLPADLLSTDLLPKIHQLVGQPLVLESEIDLALLKPGSLMILLEHLWKDLLPKPSTISVHRHRPCR
jgi:hypothetical protein